MKKILIILVAVCLVAAGVYYWLSMNQIEPAVVQNQPTTHSDDEDDHDDEDELPYYYDHEFESYIIRITDSGYHPQRAYMPRGAKVTFRNESSSENWPVARFENVLAMNPEEAIQSGDSWTFNLYTPGWHDYYNKLAPSMTGQFAVDQD